MVVSATLLLLTLQLYFSYSSASAYIIIAGGYNHSQISQALALNLEYGQWQSIGAYPKGTSGTSLATDGGENVYAFGGINADFSLRYDIDQKKWLPITPLATMTGEGCSAVMVNGSIFLIGGTEDLTGVWELTCNFAWHKRASATHSNFYSGAAVLNGYIYVCGSGSGGYSPPGRFCDKYNISASTWSPSTDMLIKRVGLGLVTLNGYLYAIGGAPGYNERFDPKTEQWSMIRAMLETRYFMGVATDGTNIYAIGGMSIPDWQSATYFSMAEVYIVEMNLWQRVAELPFPAAQMGIAFVQSLATATFGTEDPSRKARPTNTN